MPSGQNLFKKLIVKKPTPTSGLGANYSGLNNRNTFKRGRMTMTFGQGMPRKVPEGRVLAHNLVMHTIDMPHGRNGFRCWTWPKDKVPRDLRCAVAGLGGNLKCGNTPRLCHESLERAPCFAKHGASKAMAAEINCDKDEPLRHGLSSTPRERREPDHRHSWEEKDVSDGKQRVRQRPKSS